jgi:hypothetical protein
MALLTAPSPRVPVLDQGRSGGRVAARIRSTPGRLTALMLLLTLLGLVAGTATVVGVVQRAALVDGVGHGSGPLSLQAQQLYRSLSDADATAAAAFLSHGIEPAQLRQRYEDDITAAAAALSAITAGAQTERGPIDQLATQLPVYTGLVATARADNRAGYPLGAAYLREASGLMRVRLLPAAQRLYESETARLRADRSGGAQFPWLAVPLLLLMTGGLALTQRYLARRTHRLLNAGLAVATGVAVLMLGWTSLSWAAVQGHLDAGRRTGSAELDLLAKARTAALTARADEALTLVARGGRADFEQGFADNLRQLVGGDGDRSGGLLGQAADRATDPKVWKAASDAASDAQEWSAAHQRMREVDDAGNYPEAVRRAVSGGPDSTVDAFAKLDADLTAAVTAAGADFDRQAAAAADGFVLAAPGLTGLTLLMVAGLFAGFQQRIAEYR